MKVLYSNKNMLSVLLLIVFWTKVNGHERFSVLWDPTLETLNDLSNSSIQRPNYNDYREKSINKNVKMSVYPPLLRDGGSAEVSWIGIPNPSSKDMVSMSCGPTVSISDFIRSINVSAIEGETISTSGSVHFIGIMFLRCNYTFIYFAHNTSDNSYNAVSSIMVEMVESPNTPKQGHISLTENQDEMAIMFNSASQQTPKVRFSQGNDMRSHLSVTGSSTTYAAKDMCNAPANITSQNLFRSPGFMHKVILKKLLPNTRYYYQFGNDVDGWSRVYSFLSPPNDTEQEVKFIGYADMGVTSSPAAAGTAFRVFQELSYGYESFLLHFGDVSYARGIGHMWDEFFHIIEPYATKIPYMSSIGNHEYDYISGGENDPSKAIGNGFHPSWGNYGNDSSGECGVPMHHRWHVPQNGNSIFWYSFNYGMVHVIQMSSEHDFRKGSIQYKWIENDLKTVARSKTPWIILTAHRMMYTTQVGENADLRVSKEFQKEFESLLYKYKVNLMLVGHQHSYERTCPLNKRQCQSDGKGTVHVVVGSAGASLEERGFSDKIGNWSVSHANIFGYLRGSATLQKMHLEFITNENGAIYDEFDVYPWN